MTTSPPSLSAEDENRLPLGTQSLRSPELPGDFANFPLSIAKEVAQILCTKEAESHTPHIIFPAKSEHLPHILEIRKECSHLTTPSSNVPFIKPLTSDQIEALLPTTLVLWNGEEVVGTIYFHPLEGHEGIAVIGGFCVAKEHQKSGFGRSLLVAAVLMIHKAGYPSAVSITANNSVKGLFQSCGGIDASLTFGDVLKKAKQRYGDDAELVQIFHFTTQQAAVFCAQSHA